ncbi:MAG: rhomboid family intramembrane serine protease [Candidatus Pacebacteria bacterium]|nr:rhomboid family intramembrane serine protease [Candidatus Paceibacterota bacterium]
MIPLYDEYRPSRASIVTIGLIFLNTIIFFLSFNNLEAIVNKFGLIPQNILLGKELYTVFTSMFLHAGFLHLIGNMWFLWVFGNNLEAAMGRFRYLLFYLLCGFFASFIFVFLSQEKLLSIVGASGAISGILGGYFILFPKHKIKSFLLVFVFPLFFSVPAVVFLVIWILFQVFYPVPGVATGAHLIGFLAGLLLVKTLKKG